MHKLSITAIGTIAAVVVGAGAAASADLQKQAASPSWTGCYVGANTGYARADVDALDAPFHDGPYAGSGFSWNTAGAPYEMIGTDDAGISGGVEAGCDYQLDLGGTAFVLGGVADLSLMNLGATGTSAISADTHTEFGVDWAASARLRAGIAASDMLFYVTGGYALADIDVSAYDRAGPTRMDVNGGGTEGGWVAGGGVEWRFRPDWSVGVEYLHYDFGSVTATGQATFPSEAYPRFDNDVTLDTIRIGLKWRM